MTTHSITMKCYNKFQWNSALVCADHALAFTIVADTIGISSGAA